MCGCQRLEQLGGIGIFGRSHEQPGLGQAALAWCGECVRQGCRLACQARGFVGTSGLPLLLDKPLLVCCIQRYQPVFLLRAPALGLQQTRQLLGQAGIVLRPVEQLCVVQLRVGRQRGDTRRQAMKDCHAPRRLCTAKPGIGNAVEQVCLIACCPFRLL